MIFMFSFPIMFPIAIPDPVQTIVQQLYPSVGSTSDRQRTEVYSSGFVRRFVDVGCSHRVSALGDIVTRCRALVRFVFRF
jgi:hypothetical protein